MLKKSRINPKIRYIIIIIAVLFLTGILVWLVKGNSLTVYFMKRIQTSMIESYGEINRARNEGRLDSNEFDVAFRNIVEKNNFDIIVLDPASRTLKSSSVNQDILSAVLVGYVFNSLGENDDSVILSEEKYEIRMAVDSESDLEYMDLWGILDTGDIFLIRSPLSGVKASAEMASSFFSYIIVILAVALLASLIIYSRRLEIISLKEENSRLSEDIRRKEETEKMRSEFLSNISHELKTPLALIQGYAEGLQSGISDDEESKEYYLDVIVDETTKMNDIVKKMLDLNHLTFGEVQMEYSDFDIVGLINDYLADATILANDNDIHIIFENKEPVLVHADKYYIEEAFDNYFTNAVHYASGEKNIIISVDKNESGVRVSVFNNGEKIPEESLPHLFEQFYKVDKARTRAYGGSGVGLSVVKGILDAMKGSYGVENFEDGVMFYFIVPTL